VELVFSFVGMNDETQIVGTGQKINMMLEQGVALAEVVIDGYKTIKKSKTALASTTVKKVSINDPGEMLAGSVAGINVTRDGNFATTHIVLRGNSSITGNADALVVLDGKIITMAEFNNLAPADILSFNLLKDAAATSLYGAQGKNGVILITTKKATQEMTQVKARKNLSEIAFFFPDLKTDKDGKFHLNFTSPEALTAWKFRLFAHNKNTEIGYLEQIVTTQKDLMALPNFPRFFREKDTITITCKIANLLPEAKSGIAILQFFDAATMQPADVQMTNADNIRNFNVAGSGNTNVSWKIAIPEGLQGVQYLIVAKSGSFSDGEEGIIPVLTNNMLVTEAIPLWVKGNTSKQYTFENFKNNTSTTLRNHQLTVEYTSNPTWLAIEALPYLMEYEHECSEQTFARYYANALATEIVNSNPKLEALFDSWRKSGKPSKLEENEALKSIVLAETPWFADAETETEKKQKLALLFDLEKMKISQANILGKLIQKQKSSGGFAWFDGGNENEYITRHILAGLGHLKKLRTKSADNDTISKIVKAGIAYIDAEFTERNSGKDAARKIMASSYSNLHYLYARSFYLDIMPPNEALKNLINLSLEKLGQDYLQLSLYEKGMAALALARFGRRTEAEKILAHLKETSASNEDSGMYWIGNTAGWNWYQSPIETQALLIEAFTEIQNDSKSADEMKVWLIKNKQQKNWPTTKSTTEAIYALLMKGSDWLSVKDNTRMKIGGETITSKMTENEKESETGYVKLQWKPEEIKPDMATLSIENKSKVPGYGGFYWQYFEDLDKIKSNSASVLSVSKELFLSKSTLQGKKLEKITTSNPLKIGDLVTVRLVITAKENMEYVHLKDLRASCFEPIDVLSEYKWQDDLGYYMSTKDVATHFFFDEIEKGTYVISYDLRVNNIGDFSNGITTIQSMYAPEFASHTKGIRIKTDQ
jgi:TonB-dependent SusC/RagA subfamily outer membrane receptor